MKFSEKCAAAALSAMLSASVLSCGASYNSIKRMQRLEEGVSSPTTKEELAEAIKKYDARAMDLVSTQAQEGTWYKILGMRYLDEAMYGEAYECFQKALHFYPDNHNLYYYVGLCAAYIANSEMDFDGVGGLEGAARRMNYLKVSEESFQRSLQIEPKYYRSMYALGALYVFQLEQYDKAVPLLEQYLEVQKHEVKGMFILANAYFHQYEFDKAVELYDEIIRLNPSADKVADAQRNKKLVLDYQYSEN
ncbi:MAG TPA: hypothetical protein DDW78_05205 [Treponema sp.]|nr:hypothetical protein [Treponema sp.]